MPRIARYCAGVVVGVALLALAAGAWLLSLQPAPQLGTAAASGSLPPLPAPTAWEHFAGDGAATQYSSLSQIRTANVRDLTRAWTYRTGEAARHPDRARNSAFANTPILVGGSLIVCTPSNRVIALDPATGRERWFFDPGVSVRIGRGNRYVCRGVAQWTDREAPSETACATRILFGTNDLRLFAIDAASGRRCAGFGDDGEVRVQVAQRVAAEVKFNAPPAVVGDVAILGSFVLDGYRTDRPLGTVRAFDVRTGALKWTFDPVPQRPDDPASSSWKEGAAIGFGGGNVWPDMAVDAARDMVFLPTSSPSVDLYGGQRPGDNRYGNSVVALRASTGERLWDFQVVRHDIFDYDLPVAPLLVDLDIAGRRRPAVVQLTKQGLIFVLDRETGVPLFPVEERAVPASDTPGEHASPTQPIPVTMPSLMPSDLTPGEAWGFTPFDRSACRRLMAKYPDHGLYAPVSLRGTIMFPLATGGTNLGMRAYDPQRRLLIANTIRVAAGVRLMRRDPDGVPDDVYNTGPYATVSELLTSPLGAPCNPPPWGMLTALDLERQTIVWQVPLGTIERISHLPLELRFGTPNRGGPLATGGGLVFIGATMDDAFRAFDTSTGEELWRAPLPAGGQATPMTYLADGRQYVVIAAGGHDTMDTTRGDYIVAYALP